MDAIKYTFQIEKGDFVGAGEASSSIKKILRQVGAETSLIRRVAIATYEAEMNIVIHSDGGSISVLIDPKCVMVLVKDNGPGIENIELAMKEGYSTATDRIREMGFGAGMGLPNMKKCSDEFSIESKVGEGTTIMMNMCVKDGE